MTFHMLGMSSSQLTFIFFGGVETTNQYYIYIHYVLIYFDLTKILGNNQNNGKLVIDSFVYILTDFLLREMSTNNQLCCRFGCISIKIMEELSR